MSNVQCSATNSIGSNTVSVLKELEAEHFFALNLQSSISAISQTLPPLSLFSDPLCNVQSPKHIGFACCVYCSGVLFLDRPLLSWVTYSSTGATLYSVVRGRHCHKGPHKHKGQRAASTKGIGIFCAGKKCGLAQCVLMLSRAQN